MRAYPQRLLNVLQTKDFHTWAKQQEKQHTPDTDEENKVKTYIFKFKRLFI